YKIDSFKKHASLLLRTVEKNVRRRSGTHKLYVDRHTRSTIWRPLRHLRSAANVFFHQGKKERSMFL
ncbi:hypothetical protein, partial [Rhizobium leguminosarum]|uniref:hypothetical protein n=1 Tax=Rhizobium leguminosarum TaxID=384 RepID=UPI003F9B1BF1